MAAWQLQMVGRRVQPGPHWTFFAWSSVPYQFLVQSSPEAASEAGRVRSWVAARLGQLCPETKLAVGDTAAVDIVLGG